MVEHIGYPSELLEMSKLEDLYAGLELSPNAYLRNALNMTVFGTNYAFSKLREKVNKTDWVRHGRPAVVNAFYSPLENSIQFPAGILQGIFFSSDRPKYMNYGAIGWVIGHEITHGFDDQGRQFDEEGNLVDWWHPETKKRYKRGVSIEWCDISTTQVPEEGSVHNLPVRKLHNQGPRQHAAERNQHTGGCPQCLSAAATLTDPSGRKHCRQWRDKGSLQSL